MTIYMLANTMAMLLLTPQQPTTIQFNYPIEYYAVGNKSDFDSYLTKNKKILLIRPLKDKFNEFLVVITKERSYEFLLKSRDEKLTALYQITDGKREKFYTLKKSTKSYKISEGRTSIKIERVGNRPLTVNGKNQGRKVLYYPKGAPLSINGKIFTD